MFEEEAFFEKDFVMNSINILWVKNKTLLSVLLVIHLT